MIIKILGVKKRASIGRLISYIASDKDRVDDYRKEGIFQNLNTIELAEIEQAFHSNFEEFARKRKGRLIAQHIILSINPLDRERMNPEVMRELAQEYLSTACPNALAFGLTHSSQSHWHTHFLISSNELLSEKSTRQDKQKLKQVQAHMIAYIRERYPELQTTLNMKTWGQKLTNERAYYQQKRNPDIQLVKERLSTQVLQCFRSAESSNDFYSKLKKIGLKTYDRNGQVQGVISPEDSKKYRFTRLSLSQEKIKELDKQHSRLAQLEKVRQTSQARANARDLSR